MTYLDWLSEILIPDEAVRYSYQKLMLALYQKPFKYFIENDINRADDGENLRTIYEEKTGLWCNNYGPCSVLEMLGALSIRCENEIMYDPDLGNRTNEWFWDMICNLGLDSMDDWHFDAEEFDQIIDRLNDRKYCKDGYGGPFYIAGFGLDMREIELWYQLNYYLESKYEW